MGGGMSISERRALKARAQVRHAMVEAWEDQRPFDKFEPKQCTKPWCREHGQKQQEVRHLLDSES